MAKAVLTKQLVIETKNKAGLFAEVASVIADAGVNITAICAFPKAGKAAFWIITDDNERAKKALAEKKFKAKEKEVVSLTLEDKVGQAREISAKIKRAKINLDGLYGTTCGCQGSQALMILSSKDSAKIISAINS